MAGWRVLCGLLRPRAFMRIGLYSERGRADVAAARALIAERGYQPTRRGHPSLPAGPCARNFHGWRSSTIFSAPANAAIFCSTSRSIASAFPRLRSSCARRACASSVSNSMPRDVRALSVAIPRRSGDDRSRKMEPIRERAAGFVCCDVSVLGASRLIWLRCSVSSSIVASRHILLIDCGVQKGPNCAPDPGCGPVRTGVANQTH